MLIRAMSRILFFWPGRQIEATTKIDLFSKAITLPTAYFDRFGMGDLISRLANDVTHLRVFFAFGLLQLCNMVFLSVMTLGRMLSVHTTLTLVALLPLCLMVIIIRMTLPKMHQYSLINSGGHRSVDQQDHRIFCQCASHSGQRS